MRELKDGLFSDIIKLGNGKVKPNNIGSIPIYGGNGILGYGDDFNYSGETVIIGRVGAYCGSVYHSKEPIWVSDNALAAKPKNDECTKYIYYLLQNLKLNSYAEGSSHPLVTQGLLNSIEIHYHQNNQEQQAIAEVLSSLDDKIDLLHRNNKTLEEMAETLFKQWFDIEENEENSCRLGSIIKTTSGGTPSRNQSSYYGGSIPWVKSKELSGGFITNTEEHISEEGLKKSSAKLLPEYSVLLAMYGATVGEICIIPFQATCNQAICALLPSATYPYTWIHNFLKFKKDDIINLATGAAQQNISQIIIQDLLIPKPSEKIITFHKNAKVLYEKILNNTVQIEQLKTTRDTLLPKLMSGQIVIN